jgi:hypothetical protein
LTKSISYCARKKASKLAVFFILFGTSFFFMPQAQANMGLQAYFYDNYTEDNLYNGEPPIPPDRPMVFSIPVATVDQDFDSYPMPGLIDDFVVKYEGYITATESGTADLQCLADDGCIVIIDGSTVINEWVDKGMDGGVYPYTLVPNQSLPITVWYYENGGGAAIQLRWKLPTGDWTIVPEAVYSPAPKLITVVDNPTETHTVVSPETDTPVNDSPTVLIDDTQTSTSESNSPTIPSETPTAPIEIPPVNPLPVSEPVLQPEPTPTPVLVPQPEPVLVPEPEPVPTEDPGLDPEEVPPPNPEPVDEQEPILELEPEPELEPELPLEPVVPGEVPGPQEEEPVVDDSLPDLEIEPPTEPVVDLEKPLPHDEPPVTDEEKEIVAQALIEEAGEEPVSSQAIFDAGLTYSDLPPERPVEVRQDENGNEVIITAEVAAALLVLENPAELLNALFTDPAQALLALGSIGADMSPEERAESEKTIVAAVIVGQIAAQAAVTAAAGAATYRRNS